MALDPPADHSLVNASASPDPDLFRRQALEASASRYGAPITPMGLTGWGLTCFMVAVFISITIFLFVGSYTRKETVVGVLQPTAGAARVTALTTGIIAEVYVQEGQAVEEGDPILELSTDRSLARDGEAPLVLSGLMEEGAVREEVAIADQARAKGDENARSLEDIRAQQQGLMEDQISLSDSVQMQESRVRLARETFEAGLALHDRDLFSTLQLRQREEAMIAAQQGLASIQREIRQNRAALSRTQAEQGRLRAQTAGSLADAAIAHAQFDQRRAQRQAERSTVLVAAKAGRVVALQARVGTPVQPGHALAIILPPGTALQAELWVPSRAAGFLRAGERVRLMYDAFPYQKFGIGQGVVSSIAGAPTEPGDLTVPIETNQALYRVLVAIDDDAIEAYGRRWDLTPGMRLSADLVLDNRTLWEWMFDPIIAARRRAGH